MTEAEARNTLRNTSIFYGLTAVFVWPLALMFGVFFFDAPGSTEDPYPLVLYNCIVAYAPVVVFSIFYARYLKQNGNFKRAVSIATFLPCVPLAVFFIVFFAFPIIRG